VSRRKKRRTSLVVLLAVAAVATVAAAVLWRWRALPPLLHGTDHMGGLHANPAAGATPAGQEAQEEFSAAERQRLDDILRRKNRGAPR
jgi:hypothetical protein